MDKKVYRCVCKAENKYKSHTRQCEAFEGDTIYCERENRLKKLSDIGTPNTVISDYKIVSLDIINI